ncbi:TIM barrel protein [soil metagenome]
MNQHYQRYFKLGIVHFMAFPQTMRGEGPVLETIQTIAADPDFQAIEITWIKDDVTREKATALLASSGLDVYYGGQPRLLSQKLSLCDLNTEQRRTAIADIKQGIDEAVTMKALGLAVLSGKDCAETDRPAATTKLVESLQELADYAGERGLQLTIETFDRAGYAKNCLIGPTVEASQLADRVARKNFGLMLDLSHMPLLDETPEKMLSAGKAHLRHIHIGNCVKRISGHPAYGDEHPRFGIPEGENGVPELKAFLRELFRIGYLSANKLKPPVVSFEVKPMAGEASDVVIAHSKRVLRQAWAELELGG